MSLTSILSVALLGSVTGQGTVVPVGQTIELDYSGFSSFEGTVVSRGGSELLAVSTANARGELFDSASFVSLDLRRTRGGRFSVSEVKASPIRGSDGEEIFANALGLAVRNGYRGNGRGDLSVVFQAFGDPSINLLRNGDIMIALVVNSSLRIGYVTADELSDAIVSGRTLNPIIIADLQRSEGFDIAHQQSLAVRESGGRIFVYSTSRDTFFTEDGRRTLLITFEWIPKRDSRRR
ncbi:hypothetical protein FOZ63_027940 [Perkinsus olseni]|uniref:Uncharacterized protein n=1 Tax=Perkinsus olseni TaxID=32597 RepID=A0A7J6Q4P9_PEROL|nr:hypothetical protein FOZ63_027940 [Perkinsus olseni]